MVLEVNMVLAFCGEVMTKRGTFSSRGFSSRDSHLKLMHATLMLIDGWVITVTSRWEFIWVNI